MCRWKKRNRRKGEENEGSPGVSESSFSRVLFPATLFPFESSRGVSSRGTFAAREILDYDLTPRLPHVRRFASADATARLLDRECNTESPRFSHKSKSLLSKPLQRYFAPESALASANSAMPMRARLLPTKQDSLDAPRNG